MSFISPEGGCFESAALLTPYVEQPQPPSPTTCTFDKARNPTTAPLEGDIAAEYITAQHPSQSLKLPTGHARANIATASLTPHPSALGPIARQSPIASDGTDILHSSNVTSCDETHHGGPSEAAHPSSFLPCQVLTYAASQDSVTLSSIPTTYFEDISVVRPFSAQRDPIEHIRSSVSSNSQNKLIEDLGSPLPSRRPSPNAYCRTSSSRARKHSPEPPSAATTPRPKRMKVITSKDTRQTLPVSSRRRFACPFRKKNPFLHRHNTCKHGFSRISDVKQHLYRLHMTHVCGRCGSAFMDNSQLTNHQQQLEACEFVPVENRGESSGIMPTQKLQLHNRAGTGMGEGEQWGVIWRIVFPNYAHIEPSPYVDDSEKIDAVFHFAHTNGLNIARAIPEMNDVPEIAIKRFIENIRNALMSLGQVEDIPPSMESPGSEDSPQGEAIQEPTFEPQPIPMKNQSIEETEKGPFVEDFPIAPKEAEHSNSGTLSLSFDLPIDSNYLQSNGVAWDQDAFIQSLNMTHQPPEKLGGPINFEALNSMSQIFGNQADSANPASLPQQSATDHPQLKPPDQENSAAQSNCAGPGQNYTQEIP